MGEQIIQCPNCEGQGYFIHTRYVTRDMAMDACEPEMEGMPIPDRTQCQRCNGDGWIVSTPSEVSDETE